MRNFYITFSLIWILNLLSNNVIYGSGAKMSQEELDNNFIEDTQEILAELKEGDLKNVGGKEVAKFYESMIELIKQTDSKKYEKIEIDNNPQNLTKYKSKILAIYKLQYNLEDDIFLQQSELELEFKEKIDKASSLLKSKAFDLSMNFTKDLIYPLLDSTIKGSDALKNLRDIIKNNIGKPEDAKEEETLYGIIKAILEKKTVTVLDIKKMIREKKIISLMYSILPFSVYVTSIGIGFIVTNESIQENSFKKYSSMLNFITLY